MRADFIIQVCRCGLLALALFLPPAMAQEVRFDNATLATVINGSTSRDEVTLPFRWDLRHPGLAGVATLEFEFMRNQLAPGPLGLYLPKIGSAYVVTLNGVEIAHDGDMQTYGGQDTGKGPRIIAVPLDVLKAHNLLAIRLRADSGRKAGVSTVLIRSWTEAQAEYWQYWRLRVLGLISVVIFNLLIGVICLSLWLTQPGHQGGMEEKRDPLYLYSALAEFCWALRVSDSLIEAPPLQWPVWGVVPVLALGAWGCLTLLFCIEVVRWRHARWAAAFRIWMTGLMLAGVVMATWGLVWGVPALVTAWYALTGMTFLVFGIVFTKRSFGRGGSTAGRLLAGAVLLNVAVGIGDLVRLRTSAGTGDVSALYYSSMMFGIVISYIVLTRFRNASARARELLQTLEQRVQTKEVELNASYAQLTEQSKEQARVAERTRILRDMHDGVGAHIVAAIRQLQGGMVAKEEVLHTLQESLDQLKLSIDSMQLPPGDINAVLANVRYRMEPRLVSLGIRVAWDVDLLPLISSWDEKATRQLQFMVYECISNVLQHAQANEIQICAREDGPLVVMTISDNGRGFELEAEGQLGLKALRYRAQSLKAQLQVRSRPGKTSVEIAVAWG